MLPAVNSYVDMFDDEETLLPGVEHPAYGAIRVPDGRTLAWAEYGSARGLPCVLIPDTGSSRLSPAWLLHDSALPSPVRLLALDRPGTGASDAVGLGGHSDPAEDLRRLVDTLAVGHMAVIGIGQGADDAFAFAARFPRLVTSVTAVSARIGEAAAPRRSLRHLFADRRGRVAGGALGGWLAAAGADADLASEGTWAKALSRMTPEARTAVGERWQEADFRAAVAADAEQNGNAWAAISQPHAVADWVIRPTVETLPVHFWHGRTEGPTALSDIQSIAAGRPGWEVTAVEGSTAVMGIWHQILGAAAESFHTASAA